MRRARRSLSDRERDRDALPQRTAPAHRRDCRRWKQTCAQKQAELAAREKEIAREWEKRESAKLKELERRTEQALARFEEQARETIEQDRARRASERKAEQEAQRRVAKAKRELREDFETTVLATAGRIAPGRICSRCARSKKARACA